jgi:2-methylisocitrate lyase-like PEP mutase family enzyme
MSSTVSARRARFRALHETGCFILPNPWDAGSARRLENLGFAALASTSSGAAWAAGRQDGDLSRDEVLAHLQILCAATDLPVNADFEAGFADAPEGVAANVTLAAATGIAGLSIEDRTGATLYDLELATDRIRAASEALRRSAPDVLLVARTEGFLIGHTDLTATIARLTAYAEAGAQCLYAPGMTDLGAIRELVAAVAPWPVNVLLWQGLRVADLANAGVRRVSTGGALAAAAWAGFDAAARVLLTEGTLPARPAT